MYELKRRHHDNESGFTLLEVVVALAVLGLVITTGLGLLGSGLRSIKSSKDYTQAVHLATRQLEELLSRDVQPGVLDGIFGGGYRWMAEVSPESPADPELQARLFKVVVTVIWPGREKEKQLELVTLSMVIQKENFTELAKETLTKNPGGTI